MFFVIVKMVLPETRTGWSDMNTELETMKLSQFKQCISKDNLHITEWTSEISISG